MTDELFRTYESEWRELTDELYALIAKIPTVSSKERERLVADGKEKLQDAEDSVDGMSIASRGLNSEELSKKMKDYRTELDALKKQFRSAQYAVNPNARTDLFGAADDFNGESEGGIVDDHRAIFEGRSTGDSMALMQSSGDVIVQATRDVLEMDEVANRVLQDLNEQRTMMERFKDRLADINQGLDRAGQLMQEMMRRLCGNKLMLAAVMIILIGGIVAIVWLRFFPPWSSTPTTTVPVTVVSNNTSTSTSFSSSSSTTTAPRQDGQHYQRQYRMHG